MASFPDRQRHLHVIALLPIVLMKGHQWNGLGKFGNKAYDGNWFRESENLVINDVMNPLLQARFN